MKDKIDEVLQQEDRNKSNDRMVREEISIPREALLS